MAARAGLSGERLAAVDVQRLAGEEGAGHGEQDAVGDVVRGADAPGRVAGADAGDVVRLALLAQGVPRTGVDDARGDGVDPDRASSRAREGPARRRPR